MGEIKDLAKSDVRALVDATRGGVSRHIRLTMEHARPSLSDSLSTTDCLEKPAAAKWGGASSHRRVMTPESERGLVSTMGADGLFYANTVDAFGVVSAG